MGFKFPYGNEQQLNLNWFIKKFKELLVDWQHEKESIDGALDAEIQRAEDALTDVYTARDTTIAAKNDALQAKADALTAAANAAQYWQNAAASANSAATSAVTALQAAQDASNDAAQTSSDRAGVAADKAAVAADKAAVAADKATVASDKATVASDKATVAADKAAVSQDKDDVDTMKDAANAAALRSEGWADGTQNGAPVASGSPYYENNAKYYAQQAAGTSGELAQAMIADEENTTATAAHEAGDYFRIAGILYKATAAISIGDTITENVNCEKAVLANEIANNANSSYYPIGNYLYNMVHTGDMPLTTMASRKIAVIKNKIIQQRTASSSAKCVINLKGNSARVGNVVMAQYVPNAQELDDIKNIKGAKLTAWQTISYTTGSSYVALMVAYYKLVNNVYTYINADRLSFAYQSATNAFISQALTVPDDAEYYGLYFFSDTSNAAFEAIFEITT